MLFFAIFLAFLTFFDINHQNRPSFKQIIFLLSIVLQAVQALEPIPHLSISLGG
ncbi:hypothetical protein CPS_3782 [Colwellia psychrerythraea 34H]|uniref:Uncharacterized protein n=1 Tax=Colwellia psychrerythraea (strain 34H / ATCC BAA-681) TaxID=167879 RepID=Q47XM1_COLP3|nr:hypothetical protein CPS_3782 [Colwellia psychrerythraea 34H]